MALQFQQPNFNPLEMEQRRREELNKTMMAGGSLALQYQELQRNRALDAQRKELAEEELRLRKSMFENPQKYGGFLTDVNGTMQFIQLPEGYKPMPIPSPAKSGTESMNITKSEFLKSPDKYRDMGKLKIVDDKTSGETDNKTLSVPGFELSGEVVPSALEARQARDAVSNIATFRSGVQQLKSLVKKHGSTNLVGEGSAEAGTLAAELQLTLKELAKLGVLSTSDEKFLTKQLSNPDSLKSLLITNKGALNQLDTTLARAETKFSDGMLSKGYKAVAMTNQNTGGMVRVTNGAETLDIPAEDLEEAQAEGFQVVQ